MTPLILAITAALGNVVGAAVLVRHARSGLRFIETSLAFGAGFMLAVVLTGALPTVFRGDGIAPGLTVLAGYLAVHLAHHVLVPHFHFGEETHAITADVGISAPIASGFLHSDGLGMLLFLAVLLHKLPEGVTIASVVLAGGRPGREGVLAAAALGGATVLGVLLTDLAAPLQRHGLALAAGVTLYVAASNLVPEVQKTRRPALTLAFLGGALALLLLEFLTRTSGVPAR
jgi:ZIP family zinc transporter/zinc and cadmium transporter